MMQRPVLPERLFPYYTIRTAHKPLPLSLYEIKKIWRPSWFQGSRRRKNYFEGWYFKNVTKDSKHCWSFIPGVSLVGNDAHSFIQAIDGKTGKTYYFWFPLDYFTFSRKDFAVKVGNNSFSREGFELDINVDGTQITGKVLVKESVRFPVKLSMPGIMGWYRYVPFMECYHGVVSLDHGLEGFLNINGEEIIFDGGRGYIEKDWGTSMPRAWVWMQSNHFEQTGTSFMLSVARIPWIGKTFTGFLGFFLHEGQVIPFATYTGAKILDITFTEDEVNISIQAGQYNISLVGNKKNQGILKAPVFGKMDRVIHESIDATIHLTVSELSGTIIFEGSAQNAGLEMVGDLELLKS